MEKRHIVLDTETTGLDVEKGHRIIEIGGVVMNGRKKTAETFHVYVNPQREIDKEAQEVHGISNEDLKDKPIFSEIAEDLLEFIDGSTLVIHNADFDVGFLDAEFKIASSTYPSISEICEVKDTLAIARNKFPGQRNSLDALSKRFDINGYDRSYHGALLDANILADVYSTLRAAKVKLILRITLMLIFRRKIKNKQEIFQMISKLLRLLPLKRINSCTLKDLKRLRKRQVRKHYGILK